MKQVFEACGCYARAIKVNLVADKCMQCEMNAECLCFDSSDREYSEMFFCKVCLDKFFGGGVGTVDYGRDLSAY
jgi:hypothetical protein